MEMVLDRKAAELRLWPAINLNASGTRKEELLPSAILKAPNFFAVHLPVRRSRCSRGHDRSIYTN